jgi:hypothetical protein
MSETAIDRDPPVQCADDIDIRESTTEAQEMGKGAAQIFGNDPQTSEY